MTNLVWWFPVLKTGDFQFANCNHFPEGSPRHGAFLSHGGTRTNKSSKSSDHDLVTWNNHGDDWGSPLWRTPHIFRGHSGARSMFHSLRPPLLRLPTAGTPRRELLGGAGLKPGLLHSFEQGHLPKKMAIFQSYVGLPEGHLVRGIISRWPHSEFGHLKVCPHGWWTG